MKSAITLNAYAKINLFLDIGQKLENGYHEIVTVMQSVSLCDRLTVSKNVDSIHVVCDEKRIPGGEKNIAFKAAVAFFENVGLPFGANIRISKKIPSQAGLGGGSADAAAVLHALNELYNTRLSISKIAEIGAQIGADVPFCVYGGTFLATGFGEKLSPLVALSPCSIVIAKPFAGSPTKAAYTAFDALTNVSHGSIGNFLSALDSKELSETSNACFNIFEQCVNPDGVEEIKKTFKKCNALAAQMTGSGSAVFGIFSSRADAQSAYFDLASKFKDVFICSPRGKYKIN